MGLFDELVGGLESAGGQKTALFGEVTQLVTQSGGVSGLVQQFEQKGLGATVAGWVGNGENPSITVDEIIRVIGPDKITEIAAKVGLTEPQVAAGIAQILPLVVNHLTPNGTAPAPTGGTGLGGAIEAEALGLLKAKLFGS